MGNISTDMRSYLRSLTKADRAMTTAVISHYGGECRFQDDCGLSLTIKSLAVVTDVRFRDDGLLRFYEKNKDATLLYALERSDQKGFVGIGAMMLADDKTDALSDYTPNSFSEDLYNANSTDHKKAVGHFLRYLMEKAAVQYRNHLVQANQQP